MSLAVGNVWVCERWIVGMLQRRNRSIALLCPLKGSDPLQWREIRLMALVDRGGKNAVCVSVHCKRNRGIKNSGRANQKKRERGKQRGQGDILSPRRQHSGTRTFSASPPLSTCPLLSVVFLPTACSNPLLLVPCTQPPPKATFLSHLLLFFPCSRRWSHTQVEQ